MGLDKDVRITIYALTEPDTGEVRYVGQTRTDVRARLRHHLRAAREALEGKEGSPQTPRLAWLLRLMFRGEKPWVVVLEVVPEADATERERAWIDRFVDAGADLLNAVVAGRAPEAA